MRCMRHITVAQENDSLKTAVRGDFLRADPAQSHPAYMQPVAHRKHPGLGTEASVTVPDMRRGRPRRTRDLKDDDETI